MESTRYSLVKGERIVRFVLTTWLRDFQLLNESSIYIVTSSASCYHLSDVGLKCSRTKKALGTDLKILLGLHEPEINYVTVMK